MSNIPPNSLSSLHTRKSNKIPAMKWRDSDVVSFLHLYKQLECLWNNKIPDYKNKGKRAAAYEVLRRSMMIPNLTVRDVKNKIKGLRTTYSDELNKILETSGSDSERAYVPSVFWFNLADSFLREVTKRRRNSTFVINDPEERHGYSVEYEREVEIESEDSHLVYDTPSTSKASPRGRPIKAENALDLRRVPSSSEINIKKEEDEYDLFGRAIAIQLRKLPELDALELMQKTQMMVFHKNQQLKRLNEEKDATHLQSPSSTSYAYLVNMEDVMAQSTSNESHTEEREYSPNAVNTTKEEPTESKYNFDSEQHIGEVVVKKARFDSCVLDDNYK